MSDTREKRARICWEGIWGIRRGDWVDQKTAEATVEDENARYPHIRHWVEYEPQQVGE